MKRTWMSSVRSSMKWDRSAPCSAIERTKMTRTEVEEVAENGLALGGLEADNAKRVLAVGEERLPA